LYPPETFDGSVAAQKLLSCIYRTGERFGQAHVISVLLGARDGRTASQGHDSLSTFGIGKEHDRNAWRSIVRQLVAHGLIAVDVTGGGGLSISAKGRQFLREKPPLNLRAFKRVKPKRKFGDREATEFPASDRALFEKLRARRLELARAQSVPPYVIFHDRTLAEMAARRPRSIAEFAAIPGVGEAKLARYGEAFLRIVNAEPAAFTQDFGADEAPSPSALQIMKQQHPRAYEKWTPEEDAKLLSLYTRGKTLSQIGIHFERQPSAIRARLAKLSPEFAELDAQTPGH
jgi:ATP-dependent DNA helicase RecQ